MQQGGHRERNATRGMGLENERYCDGSVIGPARRMRRACVCMGVCECMGDGSGWHTWLDCVYLRTVACDYARLRVRGEGSFVCQFACRVFAIVSVSAVFACAWSRGCWFASFTSTRSSVSLVSSVSSHVCMFACLQRSHGSRVCVLVSLVSSHMRVCMFAVR